MANPGVHRVITGKCTDPLNVLYDLWSIHCLHLDFPLFSLYLTRSPDQSNTHSPLLLLNTLSNRMCKMKLHPSVLAGS